MERTVRNVTFRKEIYEKRNERGMNQMAENKTRWSRWSRRFLMLAAAFALIFCMKSTANAAGTQVVDMQKSGKVYIYKGMLEDNHTTVYHRFVVQKSGILAVAGSQISTYGTYGMNVSLCDKNKRVLESYRSSYVSTDEPVTYWVKPGTYYLKVENYQYYVLSASSKNVADRGGASKKKATNIKQKKTITGVLPAGEKGSKADWFKFKMTKDKKLQLNLEANGNTGVTFYLYGPSYKKGTSIYLYNQSQKCYSINAFTRKKAKIKKGTYYIKVVRTTKKNTVSAGYSIKWSMK